MAKKWNREKKTYILNGEETEIPKSKKGTTLEEAIGQVLMDLLQAGNPRKITKNILYKKMWNKGFGYKDIDALWATDSQRLVEAATDQSFVDYVKAIAEEDKHEKIDQTIQTMKTFPWTSYHERTTTPKRELKEGIEGAVETRLKQQLSRKLDHDNLTEDQRKALIKIWNDKGFYPPKEL